MIHLVPSWRSGSIHLRCCWLVIARSVSDEAISSGTEGDCHREYSWRCFASLAMTGLDVIALGAELAIPNMTGPKPGFAHLLGLDRQIQLDWQIQLDHQIQAITAGSADPAGSGDPAGAIRGSCEPSSESLGAGSLLLTPAGKCAIIRQVNETLTATFSLPERYRS